MFFEFLKYSIWHVIETVFNNQKVIIVLVEILIY